MLGLFIDELNILLKNEGSVYVKSMGVTCPLMGIFSEYDEGEKIWFVVVEPVPDSYMNVPIEDIQIIKNTIKIGDNSHILKLTENQNDILVNYNIIDGSYVRRFFKVQRWLIKDIKKITYEQFKALVICGINFQELPIKYIKIKDNE